MENYRKFIDHLLALRDHYQKEIQEYERSLIHAKAQLEHINALLLDQLERQHKQSSAAGQFETVAPTADNVVTQKTTSTREPSDPPPLSTPLPEVGSFEAASTPSSFAVTPTSSSGSTATESRKLYTAEQLLEQLAIQELPESVQPSATQELIELVADSVTPQLSSSAYSERSLPPDDLLAEPESTVQVIELATPVPTEPAAAESAVSERREESVGELTDNVAGERSQELADASANPELTVQEVELPTQEPAGSASAGAEPGPQSVGESTDNVAQRNEPVQLELTSPNSKERSRPVQPPKTPLLQQYQHLTKSEAVEKFLQDNIGKVFYIDDITSGIHGNLEPVEIRAERRRMYDTLKKGITNGLWDAVPNARNYYTIDLKLVQPSLSAAELSSSQQQRRKPHISKLSTDFLPQYQHLNLTQAVATIMQENAGSILTSERVARELYGELSGKALTIAKDKVGKILWHGERQRRWQRVPGQLGQYTLNVKAVRSESTKTSS